MDKYKFACGCEIDQKNDIIKEYDGLPPLHIPYDDIYIKLNYGKWCDETWNLISNGYTKGVFQLESYLGKAWAKKLQPHTMEEICALIAIIRPGTLNSLVELPSGKSKSMTQLYVDRKHGVEPVTSIYAALEPILSSTYQVLTYQEQSMQIATHIAGFNEQEADLLRKAIGKKNPELMASLRKSFVEGCIKIGKVNREEANEIFDIIEKSNRYSFNKSHSYSYGTIGYTAAFVKYHCPIHFFCSWIKFAKEKPDPLEELRQLVAESKTMGISINPPILEIMARNSGDVCIHKNNVHLGIKCIKGIGESSINKMISFVEGLEKLISKPIHTWSWMEFLRYMAGNLNKRVVNNLICSGILSNWGISRQRLLHEYNIYQSLTDREKECMININEPNICVALEHLISTPRAAGGPSTKSRQEKLKEVLKTAKNPAFSLDDTPKWILTQEKELFGTPLTYKLVDTVSSTFEANTTCKEFENGKNRNNMSMVVEVSSCREWEIKSGKNKGQVMGFITVEDASGKVDCVAFSEVWENNNHLLTEGNTVAIIGERSNKGSFMINKVFQI